MPGGTFLHGDGVALRAIQEDDLPFLDRVFNDPRVWATLGNHPPISDLDDPGFVEGHVTGDGHVSLLVCVGEDGDERAGFVDLSPATPVDGATEIVLALAPEHWGAGHGTDASRTLVDYAFAERRAHRVTARALAGNEASRRIWEGLGFTEEGRFREAGFHGGEYHDVVFYGVLEDEWDLD